MARKISAQYRRSVSRDKLVVGVVLSVTIFTALLLSGAAVADDAGPPTKLVFTSAPLSASGGTVFGTQPVVAIEDASGNIVTSASATISIAITSGTGNAGAHLGGCASITTTDGVANFSGCKIDVAGVGYQLTATDTSGGGAPHPFTADTSTAFSVLVGPISQVVFDQQPTDTQAGADFNPIVKLTSEDAGGNPVTGNLTFGIGLDGSPAALSCTGGETPSPANTTPGYKVTVTNASSATFPGCKIGLASSPPGYNLFGVVNDGSAAGPFLVDSDPFNVTAGTASKLVFTTHPTAAQAGIAFGTQAVVKAEDAAGNVVPSVTGDVSLAITSGTGASGATLSSCPAVAMASGVASFSGCKVDLVGSNYTLTATISSSAITGTSNPFIVSNGGAAGLAFSVQPGDATGGAPLAPQPAVTLKDSGGNPVSGSVTLSLVGGPAGAALTCDANPASAGTGTATFSGCSVDKAGTYQLQAAAAGGLQVTSDPFTISAGAAAKIVFDTSPAGAKGGTAFTTQPVISVEDLGGNKVPNSTIQLSITGGTGTSGASLACTGGTSLNATSGTATSVGCAIDAAGLGYKLTAKSADVVGKSAAFDVTPGTAAQLAFTIQPSGGTLSTPFGGQPQVSVTDAGGNPVADPAVPITLSISSGSLSCLGVANTLSTNAAGGAQFVGCKGSSTGSLTLNASAPGLTAADSAHFLLVSGTPLGSTPVGVPVPQTFGGSILGHNPTSTVNDVNTATGALQLSLADLTYQAVGEPLVVNRAYNSLDTSGGAFGPGWTSILDAGVTVAPNGQTAVVRGADGQQLLFTSNGSGGWNPPLGARASLVCQGVLCTVTRFNGVTFQSIDGKIQDYLSPDGIGLHFIYSGGRLSEITGGAQTLTAGMQASVAEKFGSLDWSTSPSATTANLNALDAIDKDHVWAAGNNCTLEFTANGGKTWVTDTHVTGCAVGTNLTGIAVDPTAGPGWAVGPHGTLLVCATACNTATATWQAVGGSALPPATLDFTSVWSPDANHVFAVGTDAGAGQIWACSANCKATSNGGSGAKWVSVTPSGLSGTALNAVSGAGAGFAAVAGSNGAILICNGATCSTGSGAWAKVTAGSGGSRPAPNVTFKSISVVDVNHIYAAGTAAGAGVIWACSAACNQSLTGPDQVPSPPTGPSAGPNAAWGDITPPGLGATTLTSVAGQGITAWAVGPTGAVWYCPSNCTTEPTSWVKLSPAWTSSGLNAISSAGPDDALAVGSNGVVGKTAATNSTLDRLQKIIGELGIARNPNAWLDGNHLDPNLGDAVLANLAQATQDLTSIPSLPPPPKTGSPAANYPNWVVTGVLGLSQAMRIVDANTLSDNLAHPTSAKSLSDALTQLATGDALLAAGDYPKTTDAYRGLWKKALSANGGGQSSHAPLDALVATNPAGEITRIDTPYRHVSYGYTAGGLLTSFTDANGNTWNYAYGTSGGPLTTVRDPLGNTRLSVAYSGGRVSSATSPGAQTRFDDTYTWNPTTKVSTRSASLRLAPGAPLTKGDYLDEYQNNVLVAQQLPNGATTSYLYDNQLNLIGGQDPLGRVERNTYNSAGDLLTQVNPITGGSATVSFTYNALHQALSSRDGNGNTTTYGYSGRNLVQTTPPGIAAGATKYLYNLLGEQLEADGPTGNVTFVYDGAGNQTNFQRLDLARTSLNGLGPVYTYNEIGQKLVSTDPRGHTGGPLNPAYQTQNVYDNNGNLLSTTSPGPQVTSNTYTAAGDVASTTDPAGHTTAFSWNESTLTRTATGPGGSTVSLYDPSGNLLSTTDPGDRTTTYAYDTTSRQVSVTDPTAITTSYDFDLEGNVRSAGDTAGNTSSFQYDPQNRAISSTVNGVTQTTTYDSAGNVASKSDADGRTTTWTYTSHELPATVTTAAGTTAYAYDLADNLTSYTDGNGHTTSYLVNGAGQRTRMTVDGHNTTYQYDVAGNLVSTTDPDARTTAYTLTAQNLRTAIDYSQPGHASIHITQQFDALGRRTQMTDPVTGTHNFTYDAGGNLIAADNGPDKTFSYDYSAPGKMTETYPDGSAITYSFDDGHNVMDVETTGAKVSYIRNKARRITGIVYSNGVLQAQKYNQAGLVTTTSLICSDVTELTSATLFDAAGAPLARATTAGATTTTSGFGYDGSGRISSQKAVSSAASTPTTPDTGCTSGTPSDPGSPQQNDGSGGTSHTGGSPDAVSQPAGPSVDIPDPVANLEPITYDAVGNQTSVGGTSISYNNADEVTSQTGTNPGSWSYDNAGNVTSKTIGGVTSTYTYNAANQLETVTKDGTTITYTYDGDGNRVSKVSSAAGNPEIDYSWDPSTNLPLLALERDGSGDLIRRFIYGVGPVAMQTPDGTFYLHTDQQGDITALSDNTGAVLASYIYDAFGNVTATQTGALAAPAEPVLFQGQYLDGATGLYDMRARNYDPTTGRFTQRDIVGPALGEPVSSPYVYVGDQPTVAGDPSGLLSSDELDNAAFHGHSTESADIASDVKYGLIGAKVGLKAVIKIGEYFSETAAEAGPALEDTAEVVRGLGPGIEAGTAGLEGEAGEAAGEEAGLGEGAGKLLGAAGIAVGIYFTVEDCIHGTVYQCVGDSVGLAVGAACLVATEGIGSVVCGLAAAAIGFAIAHYGPEMVAGLSQLYQYAYAGTAIAIKAVQNAFNVAGTALGGAYATAVSQITSGFNVAGAAIVGGFTSAIGAIATGYNFLSDAISTGYSVAIQTLEQAGLDAAHLAVVLGNYFNEGVTEAVNQLIALGYDIDGIAHALADTFEQGATEAAAFLHDQFAYAYDQVAKGLLNAYAVTAEFAAGVLKELGAGIDVITGALKTVYGELGAGAAAILKGLNYTVDQITGELKTLYTLGDQATALILNNLSYTGQQIANVLSSVYSDAYTAVAGVLNTLAYNAQEIASDIRNAFASVTPAEIADLLQNSLGFAVDSVARALESAYGQTAQAVAGVLAQIGDTAEQISNVLQSVFGETIAQVEDALKSFFSDDTISAIGGAFSSFGDDLSDLGDTISSWF